MSSESSMWYRVGYALEQARQLPSSGKRTLAGLKERAVPEGTEDAEDEGNGGGLASFLHADELLTTGAVTLAVKTMKRYTPESRSGLVTLLKAGAAGAAAALVVELVRPLLRAEASAPEVGADTPKHLLAGAGQGMVYGAMLEPWIPGPTILKGTVFGSLEYALHPAGGITRLLGKHSPLGRVPFMLKLLDGLESRDRRYLEQVAFGISLAVLYGSLSSSGMRDEE